LACDTAAVLERVNELDPLDLVAGLVRGKRFVQCPFVWVFRLSQTNVIRSTSA
jgi:hypothetical protein